MPHGFAGKTLRINLSKQEILTERPSDDFYRTYLGGAGFVSYYLLKEIPRGIDPLSEENRLMFALGPLTGTGIPGAARACIGAKSPLTGGIAKSEVDSIV